MIKGSHHTEETREEIRKALLGTHPTDAAREKMRIAHLGHEVSDKTSEKIREARLGKSSGMLGRPGYWLGKTRTEKTKEKIRKALFGRHPPEKTREKKLGRLPWNKGKHPTEETREKLRKAHLGVPHPCSNAPKRIFYNNTWFRSGWEAKYAEYLDKWDIKWEYEPHTFVLEVEGRKTSYTPDFYLSEFEIYHEVKGYERNEEKGSLRKVQPAREQCGINLTIIDGKLLKRIGIL